MLSFALGLSVHFLVQNTLKSSIQNMGVNPVKFHPQFCPSLSPYCLTVHIPWCTCIMKAVTSGLDANRLILQWNGEPYLRDVVKVEALKIL